MAPNAQSRRLQALIAKLEPELRAAFEAAISDLTQGVDYGRLIAALEAQDIEAAVASLNIEPGAFLRYGQSLQAAFVEGGAVASTLITAPGVKTLIRFDLTNPAAEAWIRRNVGEKITAIARETIAVARETILTGYQAGQHPHRIALDLVGRSANGSRAGGVVGLDGPRTQRLLAVTRGMETAEGVRDLVVLTKDGPRVRYKVNKATEARILRAWRKGEAVPAPDRAISERQYRNALLKARGETIAQTETLQAVMAARQEAWRQGLEKLGKTEADVIKVWRHGGGPSDPRPHHVAMSGKSVRGLETPFVFSNGARLKYAGDPDGGAAEVIRCTCDTVYSVAP